MPATQQTQSAHRHAPPQRGGRGRRPGTLAAALTICVGVLGWTAYDRAELNAQQDHADLSGTIRLSAPSFANAASNQQHVVLPAATSAIESAQPLEIVPRRKIYAADAVLQTDAPDTPADLPTAQTVTQTATQPTSQAQPATPNRPATPTQPIKRFVGHYGNVQPVSQQNGATDHRQVQQTVAAESSGSTTDAATRSTKARSPRPAWSLPPGARATVPADVQQQLQAKGSQWSVPPADHETTPADFEARFQAIRNGTWSVLPGTPAATSQPDAGAAIPQPPSDPPIKQPRSSSNHAAALSPPQPFRGYDRATGTSPPVATPRKPTTSMTLPNDQPTAPTYFGNARGVPALSNAVQTPAPGPQTSGMLSFNPNAPPQNATAQTPAVNSFGDQKPGPAYPAELIPAQPQPKTVLQPQLDVPAGGRELTLPQPGDPVYAPKIAPHLHGGQNAHGPAIAEPLIQPHAGHALTPATSGHSMFSHQPGMSGFRATVEKDAAVWMQPYSLRANRQGGADQFALPGEPLSQIPNTFTPWWDPVVRQSAGIAPSAIPVDVGRLLQDALLFSPQVTAIKAEPEVQYRVITQEAARFDWSVFLDTTYDDLNDPIGNALTTDNGADRLIIRNVVGTGGVRQKNLIGGELQLSQRIGHENQNSSFFVPNNQAATRLALSYRQPLLDGAGRAYNESEVVLARIRANSSEDEVVDALQDHLIEVTKAYWTLYRARAEYFQRRKLLESSRRILNRLEGRTQVDTIPRQVLRARAAVARAQTRIQRTISRVKDAEAQLRLLVNSPQMLNGGPVELTPIEPPRMITESADLHSVLQTALRNRPDISEAIRRMRASSVRLGVSKSELLPRLDFLVETYVADLAGSSNLRQALNGQFYDNRPGYTVGLEFEYPLENRAARAKLEQRQWELKRSINVFRATVEKSLTDVEIANREVATAYSEMLSRYQSMQAAADEADYLQDRFDVLPASEDSAVLLLEDLLDSFERVADEESSFVQAQVDHAVALIMLKKELGILLQSRHSRPTVAPTQQQWIENRINSAFDVPTKTRRQTTRLVGHSAGVSTSTAPESARTGAAAARRPMPATPTTWTRPAAGSGR